MNTTLPLPYNLIIDVISIPHPELFNGQAGKWYDYAEKGLVIWDSSNGGFEPKIMSGKMKVSVVDVSKLSPEELNELLQTKSEEMKKEIAVAGEGIIIIVGLLLMLLITVGSYLLFYR